MRNPIRLKNLRARFWPAYLAGGAAIFLSAPSAASLFAGLPWVVVGLVVRSWGAGHLVKNDLLVRTGPYSLVRHPFYLGTLCIGLGFALMLGGWSALVSLGVILPWFFLDYFPRKEQVEADRLQLLHGADYDRYRAAVPALWPVRGIYRAETADRAADADAPHWSWQRYDDNNELGTLIACLVGLAVLVGWTLARG